MTKCGLRGSLAVAVLALMAALTTGGVAQAHHSFAAFDSELQIRLTGTVARYQWANPHVYIRLDVPDENGEIQRWLIECANPGILNRVGWKWNLIKEGDEIDVIASPLITGELGALLKRIRLADGTEYSNGLPAGAAIISFDE